MIRRRRTPIERAARVYWLSRWASIQARSSRAKIGTLTTAIAIMTDRRLGPSSAARPIASSRPGTDSRMSISRMSRLSTQPPNPPARVPISMPEGRAERRETTPMSSEDRAP